MILCTLVMLRGVIDSFSIRDLGPEDFMKKWKHLQPRNSRVYRFWMLISICRTNIPEMASGYREGKPVSFSPSKEQGKKCV